MNNELTAALLTIEKCRELSGCPADVDLQDWVKQLAAENVELKENRDTLARYWIEDGGDEDCAMSYCEPTPATDRIVAGLKADGVDSGIKTIITMLNHQAPGVIDAINVLSVHSFELREGDDK